MAPMIGSDVAGIDASSFHRVDVQEHFLDLGPALDLEEDFPAGTHEGQRLIGDAGFDGAHDVDP